MQIGIDVAYREQGTDGRGVKWIAFTDVTLRVYGAESTAADEIIATASSGG